MSRALEGAKVKRLLASKGPALADALAKHTSDFKETDPPPTDAEATSLGDHAFARWKRTNTLAQRQRSGRVQRLQLVEHPRALGHRGALTDQ